MEENMQHFWHIILCYFKKGRNIAETQKDVCSVWRRCCDGSKVSKWFAKFRAGDFSLDNAPQSGRPVEVDSSQMEALIENNRCYIYISCGR